MTRHLFAKGSLEEEAFHDSIRLPYAEPDWGAAGRQLAETGTFPKSEPLFPRAIVERWFAKAGRSVTRPAVELAASNVEVAYYQLTAAEMVEQMTLSLSLRRRGKSGPHAALKDTLARLASGAKAVSESLEQIRGEILYRRAIGATVEWLSELHAGLHEHFWWAVHKRSLPPDADPELSIFKEREIGRHATLAPTALEQGCAELAGRTEGLVAGLALEPALRLAPAANRAASNRPVLFAAAIEAWATVTGEEPTLSGRDDQLDRGQLSGFHKFYCQLIGHSAGLIVRMHFPEWSAGNAEGVLETLRRLGLDQVPSVSTLRRWKRRNPR